MNSNCKTASVMIQSLCIPCSNKCRHCLLSYDGKVEGAPWHKSITLAQRLINELRGHFAPENVQFSFGYSMEHPDLLEALSALRELGSPTSEFLQCDGMAMRNSSECDVLMNILSKEKVKQLNFTFYGNREYHDCFAQRKGDFDLLLRMMNSAKKAGISFSTGICLTQENVDQMDSLVEVLRKEGSSKVFLFVPHEEGKGAELSSIRVTQEDLLLMSEESSSLLNPEIYKTEGQWIKGADYPEEKSRMILISIRNDNVENYENRSALSILQEIEALDDAYYQSFPSFEQLARLYGNENGTEIYRYRDLFQHYRKLHAKKHSINVYDVTDERQSGSRRF